MKKIVSVITSFISMLVFVEPTFAHVVVKPNQASVAAFQTFTIGVPNEKEIPTVGLRLVIPEGLQHVSPNVKPGWTIKMVTTGEGENAKVTEIVWTGGSIPVGQRDEFLFSAQVPANETTIRWKAYQTYQGGTVVSWDQEPVTNQNDEEKELAEKKGLGPYSQTTIVNDLAVSKTPITHATSADAGHQATVFSIIALALSVAVLTMQVRNKRKW